LPPILLDALVGARTLWPDSCRSELSELRCVATGPSTLPGSATTTKMLNTYYISSSKVCSKNNNISQLGIILNNEA